MNDLTRSQLDRLGHRIRAGELSETDIDRLREAFDGYDRYGAAVFSAVMACVRDSGEHVAGVSARDIKSMASVREKLLRRPMRLSDMQDIVGCRIVTPTLCAQDALVARLERAFPPERIVDHRTSERGAGYRAVHVIVKREFRRYEIQVRTRLQNDWAMLVESLVPVHGIGVKYGEGPEPVRRALRALSDIIVAHEVRVREGDDAGFSLLPDDNDVFAFLLADVVCKAAVKA